MKYNITTIYNKNNIIIKLLDYNEASINNVNLDFLSSNDCLTLHSFKSDKRKLEFYYLRLLWKNFNTGQNILYKSSGKPYLEKGFLSMTHTHKKVLIAYSLNKEVGVDIEMISDKIEKVKHKFLHPNDNYKSLKDLTQLWTIKEAVYKLFDGDNSFFMDNIEIKDINHPIAVINHNNLNLKAKTESILIEDRFFLTLAFIL